MDNPVTMFVVGTLNPNASDALEAYQKSVLPLFRQAGGTPVGKHRVIGQLVGARSATVITQMEFPSEETVRGVFESPVYREAIPNRDRAFQELNVYVTRKAT
jgi:uncharacterized protein (DUF1330 family)